MKLLSPGNTNSKLAKGTGDTGRFLNFILHLAPADLSGRNVCPNASPGCKAACLNTAGRGAFSNVQEARLRKTRLFFENRSEFMDLLFKDLVTALRASQRQGKQCAVRLNGTSDIPWERIKYTDGLSLIQLFPDIQFYDYTKSIGRALAPRPPNYHITFSKSETNEQDALKALAGGVSVAVVFKNMPEVWNGFRVINGDAHDYRFLDPKGVIVGLTAKGKARKDTSGFVIS